MEQAEGVQQSEAAFSEGTDAPLWGEHRRHERVAFLHPMTLHELGASGQPGSEEECMGVDLSRSGIAVRTKRLVQPGTSVIILLRLANVKSRAFFGVVRHARYVEEEHQLGVEFGPAPTDRRVLAWLKRRGV